MLRPLRDPTRTNGVLPWIGAVATGLLVVLAAPGVVPWSGAAWLAWVAFVPLLAVIDAVTVRQAALLGWLAGVTLTLGLCPWFPGLLARFASLHPILAILATAGIAAAHSLGWAGWAALVRARPRSVPLALLAPAGFAAIERFMPTVFPYSIGLTQYQNLRVAQLTELGGPYLLTFLFVLTSATLVRCWQARRGSGPWPKIAIAACAASIVGALCFGHLRLGQIRDARREAPTMTVAAIQAGVVHTGWQTPPEDPDVLSRYQRASAELEQSHGPVDLLLWPEKAYPLLMRADARHDYRPDHRRRVRRGFVSPLAFGLTSVDAATRQVRNSVAYLDERGKLRVVYDKVKLIVYSEWLPSWMQSWVGGTKRYERGRRLAPIWLTVRGRPAAVSFFICFESSFPAHVARLTRRSPHLLVNLSDDAWFGDSTEPEGHLSQVVFRAIESRRDLVRATGSGISAFIAATGEIEKRLPINRIRAEAPLTLIAPVRLLTADSLYRTVREGPVVCCALLSGAVLAMMVRRRRSRRAS